MSRWSVIAGLTLALASACRGEGSFQAALRVAGPWVSQGRALYVCPTRQALLVVDPDAGSVGIVPMPATPTSAVALPNDQGLAVLLEEPARLAVVGRDGAVYTERARPPGLDTLRPSPDGRFAILSGDGAELAVVDLAGAGEPVLRSSPLGPANTIHVGSQLAVWVTAAGLELIELERPTTPGYTTELEAPRVAGVTGLEVVVWEPGQEDVIAIRGDGDPPVFSEQSVRVAVPVEAATPLAGYVLAAGGRELVLAELETGQLTTYERPSTVSQLARIGDDVIFFGDGPRLQHVAVADLVEVESLAITELDLGRPVATVEATGGWFVVTHAEQDPGLSLVSADGATVVPVPLGGENTLGPVFDADGRYAYLFAYTSPAELRRIDLATADVAIMPSPSGANDLALVPGTPWLLLSEGRRGGMLTFVATNAGWPATTWRHLASIGWWGVLDD